MATFTGSDDLQGAQFLDANLQGAQFLRSDLSGAVMRGVDVAGAEIDAPWLLEGEDFLLVNGVDVAPFVEAELNRRFPGRETRRAADPDALRQAWAALEHTWAVTLDRVAGMPAGTVDVSVDGEWSFAQTLRHLVMATDKWLGGAILDIETPYHPAGQPNIEYESDGLDTAEDLTTERRHPDDPECPETTLSCLHTILMEEWEHHRFAVRDLDAIQGEQAN
jgi:hypothetical protein